MCSVTASGQLTQFLRAAVDLSPLSSTRLRGASQPAQKRCAMSVLPARLKTSPNVSHSLNFCSVEWIVVHTRRRLSPGVRAYRRLPREGNSDEYCVYLFRQVIHALARR